MRSKFPDIRLTGEEKPRKTSPRKPVPTRDLTRARCVTGPQRQELEMESVGVSGNGTISDQRSYIKIETLCSKNPTEIHGALRVFSEFTVDPSTVSRWANRFRSGCVSIDSDPRPGRPITPKDERIVKLVADGLEEDRRAT